MPEDRNSTTGTELAPAGAPPLPASPPELQGGEENFDRASTRCVAPPSPALFAGEGRGGGRPTIPHNLSRKHPNPGLTPNLPKSFLGEVRAYASGGGAALALSCVNHPDPGLTPNLPRQFRGRWASGARPEGAGAEPSATRRIIPTSPSTSPTKNS